MPKEETQITKENRNFGRSSLDERIQILREKRVGVEECVSVSPGGMLLRIGTRFYRTGDGIEMKFYIPHFGNWFVVQARVLYILKAIPGERYSRQMGVEFLKPSEELQMAIKSFVKVCETRRSNLEITIKSVG